jgi:Protein of unknown function DUF2834
MTLSRKALCVVYGVIAVIAFIGTWGNNVAYLNLGFLGANVQFWTDTLANPGSRSITVDIFLLGYALIVWMLLEARRLKMRGVWLYVVLGFLIAISVTVPVFLINRERALAEREPLLQSNTLRSGDVFGLIVLGVAFLAYTAITLMR